MNYTIVTRGILENLYKRDIILTRNCLMRPVYYVTLLCNSCYNYYLSNKDTVTKKPCTLRTWDIEDASSGMAVINKNQYSN